MMIRHVKSKYDFDISLYSMLYVVSIMHNKVISMWRNFSWWCCDAMWYILYSLCRRHHEIVFFFSSHLSHVILLFFGFTRVIMRKHGGRSGGLCGYDFLSEVRWSVLVIWQSFQKEAICLAGIIMIWWDDNK